MHRLIQTRLGQFRYYLRGKLGFLGRNESVCFVLRLLEGVVMFLNPRKPILLSSLTRQMSPANFGIYLYQLFLDIFWIVVNGSAFDGFSNWEPEATVAHV